MTSLETGSPHTYSSVLRELHSFPWRADSLGALSPISHLPACRDDSCVHTCESLQGQKILDTVDLWSQGVIAAVTLLGYNKRRELRGHRDGVLCPSPTGFGGGESTHPKPQLRQHLQSSLAKLLYFSLPPPPLIFLQILCSCLSPALNSP